MKGHTSRPAYKRFTVSSCLFTKCLAQYFCFLLQSYLVLLAALEIIFFTSQSCFSKEERIFWVQCCSRRLVSTAQPSLWSGILFFVEWKNFWSQDTQLNYKSVAKEVSKPLFFGSWSPMGIKVYRVCSIHVSLTVSFKCFEPRPYLVCHVTTIENV